MLSATGIKPPSPVRARQRRRPTAPQHRLTLSMDEGLVSLHGDRSVLRKARLALALLAVDRIRPIPCAAGGTDATVERVSLLEDAHIVHEYQRWPTRYTESQTAAESDCGIQIRPGLFEVVRLCLQQQGIAIVGVRGQPMSRCFRTLVSEYGPRRNAHLTAQFLAFLANNDCGTIRCPRWDQIPDCVAAARIAFPEVRIAVLARNDAAAQQIAELLRNSLRQQGGAEPVDHINPRGHWPSASSSLHVCTFDDGGNLPQEGVDLLFVADAKLLLERRASELIAMGYRMARIFAFVPETLRFARSETLELARYLGFEQMTLCPFETGVQSLTVNRRVIIVAQRTRAQGRRPRGVGLSTLVREEIIEAGERNSAIAIIAHTLMTPKTAGFPRRIAPAIREAKQILRGHRVLVVAEHVEHAIALTAVMPRAALHLSANGWKYLHALDSPPSFRRITGFEETTCIITTRDALGPRLENIRCDCFDAVLLAGGWTELPEEFELLAKAEPFRARPLLCVTFFDARRHQTEIRAIAAIVRQTRWWSPGHQQTQAALADLMAQHRRKLQ